MYRTSWRLARAKETQNYLAEESNGEAAIAIRDPQGGQGRTGASGYPLPGARRKRVPPPRAQIHTTSHHHEVPMY